MVDAQRLIQRYEAHLEEVGLASASIKRYSGIVAHLLSHIEQPGELHSKEPYYRFFEASLKDSPSSFNLKKTAVKHFYRMLSHENTLDESLTFSYRRYTRLPVMPTLHDLKQLELILRHGNLNVQQKLAIELVRNHGLTSRDIVQLDMTDIIDVNSIVVLRGDQYEMPVTLTTEQSILLIKHLQERQSRRTASEALFISRSGDRISNSYIANALSRINRLYRTKLSVTRLRNQFIVNCLDSGIGEPYIAAYMGIKSFKHIHRYRCFSKSNIDEAKCLLQGKGRITSDKKSRESPKTNR